MSREGRDGEPEPVEGKGGPIVLTEGRTRTGMSVNTFVIGFVNKNFTDRLIQWWTKLGGDTGGVVVFRFQNRRVPDSGLR